MIKHNPFPDFEHLGPDPEDELPDPTYLRADGPRVATLSDLDVNAELLKRYYDCVDLLASDKISDKEKTAVMNSLMNIMKVIVELRNELFNMERMQKCEQAMIETLQEWPAVQDVFLKKYKDKLNGLE